MITYNYEGHPLNLAQFNALAAAKGDIQGSQLIVIQNCLNEIYRANFEAFKDNMQFLMANMAPGSALLLSDLKYSQTTHCLRLLKTITQAFPEITIVYDHGDRHLERDNVFPLPFTLRRHLMTGENGLMPRRRIKQFSLCLLKR